MTNSPPGVPEIPARPNVSVVIPARNEAGSIERAIRPLLVDPSVADLEVIVADGRSTDRTREVVLEIAARDPRVRLIDNPERITPYALNAAIRASRGDVISWMSGHAEPSPDFLVACLRVLRETGAWNVGGQMIKTGSTEAARAASAAASSPFGIGGGRRHHLADVPTDLDSVWPGCYPRWVFERVGLFDPEMVHNQDEELNRRILNAGGRIRFDPSIRAMYHSRGSWRGLFRQYFRYGMYRVRSAQKHPSMLRFRHLAPPGLIATILGGAALGVAGLPLGWLVAAGVATAWMGAAIYFAGRATKEYETTAADVVRAFVCLHLGYGLGFWAGMTRFFPRWFVDRRGAAPVLAARADGSAG